MIDSITIIQLILQYALAPVAAMGWYMLKKQESRVEDVEYRTNAAEKSLIELKAEVQSDIKYMSRDIKEIKEMLRKISCSN